MDASVVRRVLKGFGANAYDQVITVIVQLVGVPVLLHAWGAQLYGEWLILFAIPAYLSMSDLGFSQSASNDMTARVARGDRAGALAVFQSLAVLVYSIAGIGLVLVTVLLWSLPLHWLHFAIMDAGSVHWVLWLLAAEVFVRLPNGVTHAGFRASGDEAIHIGVSGTVRMLQFAGVWIAALAGGGPVAAAAAFFGVRALGTSMLALVLFHRRRWLRFDPTQARRRELRGLLKPALANLALPCAQALNVQGMVLVVGAVLGPLAVVVFSTARTLTRLALQAVAAVSHAVEPELARAHGAGNGPLMQSLFLHSMRAGLWLALAASSGLALFGSFVLDVWTHGKVAMDPVLFGWLLGSAAASVLWYGALIVLKAANQHLRAASVLVFASGAAVALAGLLLGWTGNLATAGLALLLMDVAMALYTFNAAARMLGVDRAASLLRMVNPGPLLTLALARVHVRRS